MRFLFVCLFYIKLVSHLWEAIQNKKEKMESKRRKERLGVRVGAGVVKVVGGTSKVKKRKMGIRHWEGGANESIFHLPSFTYPSQVSVIYQLVNYLVVS